MNVRKKHDALHSLCVKETNFSKRQASDNFTIRGFIPINFCNFETFHVDTLIQKREREREKEVERQQHAKISKRFTFLKKQ